MDQLKQAFLNRSNDRKTDLAPPTEKPPIADGAMDMTTENAEMDQLTKLADLVKDNPEASDLVAQMIDAQTKETGADDSDVPALSDDMTDFDKKDVMDRDPRSLGERARKDELLKKMNK